MGEWRTPNHFSMLYGVVSSEAFHVPPAYRRPLIMALVETGMMVREDYYVPDVDELYAGYEDVSHVDYYARRDMRGLLRWVMCAETHHALYEIHGRKRVPRPVFIDFNQAEPDVSTLAIPEIVEVVTEMVPMLVVRSIDAGRLFGMPIRRDPAARRPLLELIPKEER